MQTRKDENDFCPATAGMWEGAISCTESINKGFGDCLNDKDSGQYCMMMACASGGTFPLSFCAAWIICCSLPPLTAAVFTPVTGLVDCSIFSAKQFGKCIDNCINGPERQVMQDTENTNSLKQYGSL